MSSRPDLPADAEAEQLAKNIELSIQLHEACSKPGSLEDIKDLIESGAAAWFQDSDGWTALHHAAEARWQEAVEYLLRNGAVWNLVDNLGFTAADIAYSLNDTTIYQIIVMEGVRSELLKAVLAAQDDEDDNEEESMETEEDAVKIATAEPISTASDNKAFLASRLRYEGSEGDERCIDEEGNGVMMGWELPIMEETARLLCKDRPSDTETDGEDDYAVLNVGFGLGLVDNELQKYKPTRHVIIEPHKDVLAFARSKGWYEKEGVSIFEGTWQEYVTALEAGEQQAEFDAVYFDTFSEHYSDLHAFFDHLPNLLRGEGSKFSFFHGLGATSISFYEIYTQVSEMHLQEIGLKTEWHEVSMLDKGESTWEGITRRYWNIPCAYRLPICTLEY